MISVHVLWRLFFLSSLCIVLQTQIATGDWRPPEAVAPDAPYDQVLAQYSRRCIAVDGSGTVHVAWRHFGSGEAIYYNARVPGVGWGNESFRVSAPSAYEFEAPSICCDAQGNVFVAWGVESQVYYRGYSVAAGWDTAQTLFDYAPWGVHNPSVALDDTGNVHVVWVKGINSNADRVIYRKRTPSQGWSDDFYVVDAQGNTCAVAMVEDHGSLHVVWDRYYASSFGHIFYRRYTPGIGWDSTATELGGGVDGSSPSIAVDSRGCVHVVWETWPAGAPEVAYRRWTPSEGWDPLATMVSVDEGVWSRGPDVAVGDSGCVHVVWYEAREEVLGGVYEVYERVLTPGIGWGDEARLTDWPYGAGVPHVTSDNCGSFHMVYESYQSVSYIMNPGAGSSSIPGVDDPGELGPPLLTMTGPNPFRDATTIHYCLPQQGFATLGVYTVTGQLVAELFAGSAAAGPHSASWGGHDSYGKPVQSGVYFIRLQSGSQSGVKPVVLFR